MFGGPRGPLVCHELMFQRTWKDFGALPIEASIRLVVHQSEANLTFLLDFVSLKKRIMSEGC